MSVGLVLSQFEILVARAESMDSKLSARNIRPTNAQLDQFRELKARLASAVENIDAQVTSLSQPHTETTRFADQIRSIKSISHLPSSTMLSRNLILIFAGPKISSLDSKQVKANKEHTQMRCDALKSQHPHVILMWAAALPPSSWKTRKMTDNMFDSLIHTLKADWLDGLLPEMRRSLESLGEEEPLNTCNPFKNFISEVLKLNAPDKTNEGSETFPTRTKRTLAEADPSEEPSSNKKVCGESRLQGEFIQHFGAPAPVNQGSYGRGHSSIPP
jgi:hypothetical protein